VRDAVVAIAIEKRDDPFDRRDDQQVVVGA
jgi:hypothetical protein